MAEKHESWKHEPYISCLIVTQTVTTSSHGRLMVCDQNVWSRHGLWWGRAHSSKPGLPVAFSVNLAVGTSFQIVPSY